MNARAGAAVGAGGFEQPAPQSSVGPWALSLLVGTRGVASNNANGWVGRCGQGSTGETGWRGGAAARSEARRLGHVMRERRVYTPHFGVAAPERSGRARN